MALNEFEGTVMLVSHDRALLREVCDEFWLVRGGELKPFDGDLDDTSAGCSTRRRRRRAARPDAAARRGARRRPARGASPAAPPPRRGARRSAADATRADRKAAAAARQQKADAAKPLKKELNVVDNRLGVLFAERDTLEAASADDASTPRSAPRTAGA